MGRAKKKAKKLANKDNAPPRWRMRMALNRYAKMKVGDVEPVLGMNVFCMMVDEANFMGAGQHRMAAYRNYCDYEEPQMEKHDNEMLALAEMLASKKQILSALDNQADWLLRDAMKRADTVDAARWQMTEGLTSYCKEHYYSGFQRKKTVDKLVKKKLKDYVKFEREVTRRAEQLIKEAERKGGWLGDYDARTQAVRELV